MFKKQITAAVAAAFLSASVAAIAHESAPAEAPHAERHAHWTYDGSEGPDHWGEMEAKFSTCSSGKNQSPVNLTDFIQAELKPLTFNYKAGGDTILNNGHTIQVNFADGSEVALNNGMDAHFLIRHLSAKVVVALLPLDIERGIQNEDYDNWH